MILAQEFRIGNIIRVGQFICTILTINNPQAGTYFDCDFIQEGEPNKSGLTLVALKDVEAIPLTAEIFEACGFKRCGADDDYIVFRGNNEEICNCYGELYFYGNSGPIGMPLKTLHQLQNLYFALNGGELMYTL